MKWLILLGAILLFVYFVGFVIMGGSGTYVSEGTAQSYDTYRQNDKLPAFDPIGATDISHMMASDFDTSDRWLKFTMPQEAFTTLVQNIADTENGPSPLQWQSAGSVPSNWVPEHPPPSWWTTETSAKAQSLHWCYPTDTSGMNSNYHGWYFSHDAETNVAMCWHWRYQWAGDMCD